METTASRRPGYPSDLTDPEWELVRPFLFPEGRRRGRGRWRDPRSARACLDGIRFILKAGCQWSMLPRDFPPRSTVHDAFAEWTASGLWERINTALRERVRTEVLKKTHPPARASSTARA